MADADLVIVLLDGSQGLTEEDRRLIEQVKELNYLVAINKNDLEQVSLDLNGLPVCRISAKTGEGLEELQKRIVEPFMKNEEDNSGFLISDARHFDLLERAAAEVEASINLLKLNASEEIILVGLHNALNYLGQITGETTTEDMLTQIFSTFCIGK